MVRRIFCGRICWRASVWFIPTHNAHGGTDVGANLVFALLRLRPQINGWMNRTGVLWAEIREGEHKVRPYICAPVRRYHWALFHISTHSCQPRRFFRTHLRLHPLAFGNDPLARHARREIETFDAQTAQNGALDGRIVAIGALKLHRFA